MKMVRLSLIILAITIAGAAARAAEDKIPNPDPERFAHAVETYEKQDRETPPPAHPILFYGSSSIRMWKLGEAFPGKPVLNHGFGGSHISDCIYYFDRLVKPCAPSVVVFYAGDNDVDAGKGGDQVCADFAAFTAQLRAAFPDCKLYYLAIKPSLARWEEWPATKAINEHIRADAETDSLLTCVDVASPILDETGHPRKSLFRKDGLHLNDSGYAVWNKVVRAVVFTDEKSGG